MKLTKIERRFLEILAPLDLPATAQDIGSAAWGDGRCSCHGANNRYVRAACKVLYGLEEGGLVGCRMDGHQRTWVITPTGRREL